MQVIIQSFDLPEISNVTDFVYFVYFMRMFVMVTRTYKFSLLACGYGVRVFPAMILCSRWSSVKNGSSETQGSVRLRNS